MQLRDGDVMTRRNDDDVRQWRKRRHRMPFKQTLVLMAFISAPFLCCGIGVYVLFFSPYFIIDLVDVKVSGGLDASSIKSVVFRQMDNASFAIFSQKRIYFFDTVVAEQSIRKISAIDTISIRKKFPNTLIIEIEGKPFKLVWFSAGHFYEVASDGSILREIEGGLLESIPRTIRETALRGSIQPSQESKEKKIKKKPEKNIEFTAQKIIPIVIDEEQKTVEKGAMVLDNDAILFLSGIQDALQAIGVNTLVLKKKQGLLDIRVLTTEGWEILFTLLESDTSQVANLSTVLKEKIKGDRKRLKYVDVRFSNRIYYAYRN